MKFTRKNEAPKSGGDKYIKLKSGESIYGVFRGEIFEFYQKWENGKSLTVEKSSPGAKVRFEANFITMVDGKFVAKIFGFPLSVYSQLEEINREYGDVTKIKVKVTRHGEKLETEWNVLPIMSDREKLNAQSLDAVESVPLNILNNRVQVSSSAPYYDAPMPDEEDSIPF